MWLYRLTSKSNKVGLFKDKYDVFCSRYLTVWEIVNTNNETKTSQTIIIVMVICLLFSLI